MKATGIVRRIDELGRVVIPKEIRRTLRIREGDPLEIFTDRDGGIMLRKYSPIGELSENAQQLATALSSAFSLPAAICDKDTFVASAGLGKRELAGRAVSGEIERMIVSRTRAIEPAAGEVCHALVADGDLSLLCGARILLPILSQGDAIGAVLLFSQKPDCSIDPAAVKACETVAAFLGIQMT